MPVAGKPQGWRCRPLDLSGQSDKADGPFLGKATAPSTGDLDGGAGYRASSPAGAVNAFCVRPRRADAFGLMLPPAWNAIRPNQAFRGAGLTGKTPRRQ